MIEERKDGGRVDSVVFQNPLPPRRSDQCCHRQLDLPNVLQGATEKEEHVDNDDLVGNSADNRQWLNMCNT